VKKVRCALCARRAQWCSPASRNFFLSYTLLLKRTTPVTLFELK